MNTPQASNRQQAGSELFYLSISEASRLMLSGKLSPLDLVDAFLNRIDTVDEKIHSYLLVTADRARAAARLAEKDIAEGRWRGPLHGIPYAVKDNYFTKGIRTCAGSKVMIDHIPDHDAAAVEKLDASGAILLGKLNTWEYGTGTGDVHFDLPYPPARNPWHLEHFTGGSSTGSGAAVAAGTAMVAMGSDTGGSVRLPSAACGLQGLKSTFGRVSRYGMLPNCYSADIPGALTWTVEDSALMLRAVAGFDPRDPASAQREVPDYLAGLENGVRGMTIGIVRDFGIAGETLDESNRQAVEDMVAVLAEQGARIVELTLPAPVGAYHDTLRVINWTESLSIHEHDFMTRAADMGQALRDKLMSGFMTRAVDYLAAQRRRRELSASTDALIQSVDAIVMPGAFHVAPPFSDHEKLIAFTSEGTSTVTSVSGHPAMSVCTGFDNMGLPTNAQIIGRYFDEATILRVARAYERATQWRDYRPVF